MTVTSAIYRRRARNADRRQRGRRRWRARSIFPATLPDGLFFLFFVLVLASFCGLSCYDDDGDCHTHIACCGGIVVITHCHSDDDDGHSHPGYDPVSQVAVLATDAPAEGVRSLYVTVTEITLESSEAHPQTVYRSETGQRLDLLSLRGSEETRLYELLAAPALVHAATYDSIWISVKDPVIVLESGEVVGTAEIELDGALEIVFREPIFIGPEDANFLVLDFDVERSLSRTAAGDVGSAAAEERAARWRFRPLIFADVMRDELSQELFTPTDIEGTIDEVDAEEETLDVDLPDGRGSVTVHSHLETVLLGPGLEPLRFEDMHPERTVRVRGYWRPDGGLDAQSVLEGSTFRVTGRVERIEQDDIVVSVATEESRRETVRVAATREALLSFDRLWAATLPDVEAGIDITMTGYRAPGPGEERTAALIDLRGAPARQDLLVAAERSTPPRAAGRVTSIDRDSRTIVLRSAGGDGMVESELHVPHDSEILFLERTGGVLWQTPMHFEQIREGTSFEVERLPGDGRSPELFLFHRRE